MQDRRKYIDMEYIEQMLVSSEDNEQGFYLELAFGKVVHVLLAIVLFQKIIISSSSLAAIIEPLVL